MALPSFILLIAFLYVPLYGWIYAFFKYRPGVPLSGSPFVGLEYFRVAFGDKEVLLVLRNTLVLSFLTLLCTPLPAIGAILLSEIPSKRFRNFLQTVTTIPNFISWVLVYSVFFSIFSINDGLLNQLLFKLHLINDPTNFLGDADMAWYFQTAVGLWKSLGFSMIIYIAAIAGIDPSLYEAAKVDGAGRFQMMRHITVPGIAPTFMVLLILGIGSLLSGGSFVGNAFEQYFVFNNQLVTDKLMVLDLYVYRIGLQFNDYSFSIAIGMTKTIVSLILLFSVNWISKKIRGQSII
ncbi:sugar ABC transporter permease [Paenibacillus psychroresistens]|uniref:Sugar ABC transporter permease n=2 Tax=Paenibacillus psychroresistens TaxID=1778678 RepID=A0A6B8RU08_9BACL|nr:sugar ABC transporter permease [Paenibacillus psychroresistens]